MSGLIPQIPYSEFKKLKASQIRELKACEVIADGEHLFTAIIPHSDLVSTTYIRTQAEYLGMKANMVGGKDLDDVKEESLAPV